jgi:pimeloyl-ACP methyl ester carboxylesterase
MEILKDGIADSEQIILETSAHCGMWEEPVDFWKAVLGFINRHGFL